MLPAARCASHYFNSRSGVQISHCKFYAVRPIDSFVLKKVQHLKKEEALKLLHRIPKDSSDWENSHNIDYWISRHRERLGTHKHLVIGDPIPKADLEMNVYNTASMNERIIGGIAGAIQSAKHAVLMKLGR